MLLSGTRLNFRNNSLGLPPPCLHGGASDKVTLFRERYTILQQVITNWAVSPENLSSGFPIPTRSRHKPGCITTEDG